jgi:hypothetical protein
MKNKGKIITTLEEFKENLNISDVSVSLPSVKDWSDIQEEVYDECMDELINDDAPITAFIEWLQKKYPNGVKVN